MKKSALIKLVKEELAKKKVVKEEKLSSLAQALADAMEFGTPPFAFGKAVAEVLYDEFKNEPNKSELVEIFMKGFNSVMMESTVNENQKSELTKAQLIDAISKLPKDFTVGIPKIHKATPDDEAGSFDTTSVTLRTTPENAIKVLNSTTEDAKFKVGHKIDNYISYQLVQSEEAKKRAELVVRAQGLRDV